LTSIVARVRRPSGSMATTDPTLTPEMRTSALRASWLALVNSASTR
jgi:hypothetical protein